MSISYRAAWVPADNPQRDWNEASDLAIAWIETEATEQGTHAVLVTNGFDSQTFNSPLNRYVRGQTHFTPRSRRPDARSVPVLAFLPTREALAFAIGLARGSSLCVVESITEPVAGWAADVSAINLLSGVTTPPHAPALATHLDRLAFYGNNSFSDTFGKQMAGRILHDLQNDGLLEPNTIVSALAARNISPRGQQQIKTMIDRMTVQLR